MDDLMAQGMRYANQALLAGCSAGGVSTILHCDEFRGLFPSNTRVKCLADAGMFLDTVDVRGRREMRSFFDGIVRLQVCVTLAAMYFCFGFFFLLQILLLPMVPLLVYIRTICATISNFILPTVL
jgi:hypothetical protein